MPVTILVNGRTYPVVAIDDFTLDEAMIAYEYTKLPLDELGDVEGFHPGLMKAFIHISVARGEPGVNQKTIGQTVGALKLSELEQVFMDVSEEVPENPTAAVTGSPGGGSGGAGGTSAAQSPAPSPEPPTGNHGSATGATFALPTSGR